MASDEQFPVHKPDEEWRRELTPEQYRVLRGHGTERAGTSPLNEEHRAGIFLCAACGQQLFDSQAKFDWGVTGPPETFVVDPQGVVVVHIVGRVYASQLEGVLGRLEAASSGSGNSR